MEETCPGKVMEFTQGGDVRTEKHLVATVRVLVEVSEQRETHTVANTETVSRSLILLQCKLQQFIFASVATHYTLIDKRKEHSPTNRKEQAPKQCSNMHFASQNP